MLRLPLLYPRKAFRIAYSRQQSRLYPHCRLRYLSRQLQLIRRLKHQQTFRVEHRPGQERPGLSQLRLLARLSFNLRQSRFNRPPRLLRFNNPLLHRRIRALMEITRAVPRATAQFDFQFQMVERMHRMGLFHLPVVGLMEAKTLGTLPGRPEFRLGNSVSVTSKTDSVWHNFRWHVRNPATDNINVM